MKHVRDAAGVRGLVQTTAFIIFLRKMKQKVPVNRCVCGGEESFPLLDPALKSAVH